MNTLIPIADDPRLCREDKEAIARCNEIRPRTNDVKKCPFPEDDYYLNATYLDMMSAVTKCLRLYASALQLQLLQSTDPDSVEIRREFATKALDAHEKVNHLIDSFHL